MPENTPAHAGGHPPAPPSRQAGRVTALKIADLAAVLSRLSGKPVTVEMIQADIEEGAPANPDGTVNLVHYAAWLARTIGSQTPDFQTIREGNAKR